MTPEDKRFFGILIILFTIAAAFVVCCHGQAKNTNAVVDITPPLPTNAPSNGVVHIDGRITLPTNGLVALYHWEVVDLPPPPGLQGGEPYTVIRKDGQQIHYEPAVEWSNLVARILWKGRPVDVVLESNPIRIVNKAFILQEIKQPVQ